jgi:hypothetical protein
VAMFGAGGACGSFAIRQMLKFPTWKYATEFQAFRQGQENQA